MTKHRMTKHLKMIDRAYQAVAAAAEKVAELKWRGVRDDDPQMQSAVAENENEKKPKKSMVRDAIARLKKDRALWYWWCWLVRWILRVLWNDE